MEASINPVKKRSAAIDMVKGFSIMTLFYLHFEQGCFDYKYNYFLVRSPAFYMVVGWLWGMSSHDRTVKEHWDKRKIGLVRPYICFSLFFIFFDIIMWLLNIYSPFIIERDIYKTLCLRGIGTLWFLPALLGGEMLFLSNKHKPFWIKSMCYLLALFTICLYIWWNEHYTNTNKELLNAPFRVIKDISDAFIYLSIAFYFSKRYGKFLLAQHKINQFLIGFGLLLLDFYITNLLKIEFAYPISILVFMVCNMFSGIGIIMLFTSIENFKPISNPLVYCGKNSLIIMVMHYCFLLELTRIFDQHILHYDTYFGNRTIIYFFVALVLQVLIIEIINHHFKYIIGKS